MYKIPQRTIKCATLATLSGSVSIFSEHLLFQTSIRRYLRLFSGEGSIKHPVTVHTPISHQ